VRLEFVSDLVYAVEHRQDETRCHQRRGYLGVSVVVLLREPADEPRAQTFAAGIPGGDRNQVRDRLGR
jgi:hypothetical protein